MEGGVGAFTQELAKALFAAGHEIHIITSRHARPPEQPRKVALLHEPIDIGFAQLFPTIRHWRRGANRQVVDWAIRFQLDIVNIQYQAAAYDMFLPAINFLPWRLKHVVKTAVTFHDLRVPYLFPKVGDRARTAVVQRMAKTASGAIATNQEDYKSLKEIGVEKAVEIPIGSNITPYTPNHIETADVRDSLGVPPDGLLLGYFGFLNESKGADTLIKALAEMDKKTHVVFIGGQLGASDAANNSGFLGEIQSLVASLGVEKRVHWTGFLSDNRVSTFLHAADMMVLPYREGASLRRGTLMAALAHGRPLISTWPIGETPLLAHQENIWFVPVDDPAAVAAAVATLKKDDALRNSLAECAARTGAQFSWERIAAKTAVFLESLLKN